MLHFLKSAIIDLIFQEKDSKFHDINSDGDVISDLFCHVVVEGWQKETGTLDSHHNAMAHYLSTVIMPEEMDECRKTGRRRFSGPSNNRKEFEDGK